MVEIDVEHTVNAVRRTVGTRVLDAGEANVVTISRVYPTDVADLWDACTNLERIPRWFAPVTGSAELGGTYQVQGNASGTILTCEPPNGFTATWEFGGGVSWIELRISDEGDGTARLALDHIALVGDDIWEQFGPGAVGIGWDLGLLGLYLHLTSGFSASPEFEAEFAVSDDGRGFIAGASDGWRAANIAAGAAPDAAEDAAKRCTAFYTGEGDATN